MKYYVATNTGKGFITHEDNETAHVAGYPAEVWATENAEWATRVGAVEKTKVEAQALIDTEWSASYSSSLDTITAMEEGEEKDRLLAELTGSAAPILP